MMNAYQRPLFRQAGGPAGIEALPPPPPAGVAAIPQQDPQAMVEAAGQMASSEMEAVGQDYVTEMMQSLDTAENFKTVIDALRGNKLPMNERFAELAEYVGEDDAEKTPESVLAMVQPVIMMTEEGNVDSGIGQLMQGLTGEVDMMTADGGLTDMGQGVGSLMVANQAPPPQQFANGGAVQHFANGDGVHGPWRDPDYYGNAYIQPFNTAGLSSGVSRRASGPRTAPETDVKTLFPQYQSMFRDVLDSDAQRKQAQSGIMFDIAQAGLNLASGVDPRTGESTTSLPLASQVATAASGLPGMVSERIASVEGARRAGDLAALEASIGQVGSERQLAQQIESREALAAEEFHNQFIITEAKLRAEGEWRAADRLSDEAIARLRLQWDQYQDAGSLNSMRRMLGDPNMLARYAAGESMVDYEAALSVVYGRPFQRADGTWVEPSIPQEVIDASRMRNRVQTGATDEDGNPITLTVPDHLLSLADGGAVQQFQQGAGVHALPPELTDPDTERALPGVQYSPTLGYYQGPPPAPEPGPRTSVIGGEPGDPITTDPSKAFGVGAFLAKILNPPWELGTDIFGEAKSLMPEHKEAISLVNTLAEKAFQALNASWALRNNMVTQQSVENLNIRGGRLLTDITDAIPRVRDTRNLMKSTLERYISMLEGESPLDVQLSGTDRSELRLEVENLGNLVFEYDQLYRGLTQGRAGADTTSLDRELGITADDG